MEEFIAFFENIPTTFRTGLLLGGIVLFWVLEGVIPLYGFKYNKVKHAGLNLFFTLTTAIIGFGFAWLLLKASQFTVDNQFGLLYIVELPLWAHIVLGVLLLDFIGAYFIHWTEHKVKWMWQFHVVHHSDTKVDVTTGLRHHPGETVFRIGFTIMAVLLIGVPMGIIMLYQSLSVLFAHLTHANIKMPVKLDRALSYIFVTPYMHKVHHHYTQPFTDTNYGNIFSIWDRIFGTFAETDSSKLTYGIDTFMDPKENEGLSNLLAIPFKKYRPPVGAKFGEEIEEAKVSKV
ncbi:fatty acid hydroxylase family protein [Fulvivirga sp. RKSG066]|uniref:sterol desaturase family protein n=1 Tax=Fulvivirga aurantia TaxID=2529383 RepID=UPI0012BC087E|nr:sterol desaturase family protein [Fulvivirga aurantia]MTI21003.1 fatty acid hydroxylase family protein [Fulvivirga aurantia]